MRTLECNHCGEPLTAHDDETLAQRLLEHAANAHPQAGLDAEQARAQVRDDAYAATDS